MIGHQDAVRDVAFSRTGQYLCSGSNVKYFLFRTLFCFSGQYNACLGNQIVFVWHVSKSCNLVAFVVFWLRLFDFSFTRAKRSGIHRLMYLHYIHYIYCILQIFEIVYICGSLASYHESFIYHMKSLIHASEKIVILLFQKHIFKPTRSFSLSAFNLMFSL